MDTQTDFDATAQKLYKDYIDADNELAHAQCAKDAADFIEAYEGASDLPPLQNPVEPSDKGQVVADCPPNQIEQSGMRKLFIAARCLNEVLKPQMFKSDWRVKFEKKAIASAKLNLKFKTGEVKRDRDQWKNAARVPQVKTESSQKIGNKYKRQRGAAMTDYAM
jgi:hypothetical protein